MLAKLKFGIIYFFHFLHTILTCLLLIVVIVGVCEEPGLQKRIKRAISIGSSIVVTEKKRD